MVDANNSRTALRQIPARGSWQGSRFRMAVSVLLAAVVFALAVTACGNTGEDGRSGEIGSGTDPDRVEPVSFNVTALDNAAAACVRERTGIASEDAPAPVPDEPVHLYYAVGVACRVTGGEEVLPVVARSFLEENPILSYVSACLATQHSWPQAESVSKGIGGVVPPEPRTDAAIAEALVQCGFHDAAAIEQILDAPGVATDG